MNKAKFKSLEEFSLDFGQILLRNQRAKEQASGAESTLNAQGFARYLRAARLNLDLTPPELATFADVPEEIVYAIEQGLIYSIDDAHLQRLALTLDEEIDTFELILGREISSAESVLAKNGQMMKIISRFGLVFAFMLLLFLSIFSIGHTDDNDYLASGMWSSISGGTFAMLNENDQNIVYLGSRAEKKIETQEPTSTQPTIITKQAIHITIILALLLLLLGLAIKNGDFPTNLTFKTMSWPKNTLVYTMPLLLICLFGVMRYEGGEYGFKGDKKEYYYIEYYAYAHRNPINLAVILPNSSNASDSNLSWESGTQPGGYNWGGDAPSLNEKDIIELSYLASQQWGRSEPWGMSNLNGLSIYFPLADEWKREFYRSDAVPSFMKSSNESDPNPLAREYDPKECIVAPMHIALTIDEEDLITNGGRLVWVPVSLQGADKADDVRGVQISVNVEGTSILVPASGLKPREEKELKTSAYHSEIALVAGTVKLERRPPNTHGLSEVKLSGGVYETQSDLNGEYSFANIPNTNYSIRLDYDSEHFLSYETTININGLTSLPDVTLCTRHMNKDDNIDEPDRDMMVLGIIPLGVPSDEINADSKTNIADWMILSRNIAEARGAYCGSK